MVSLDARLIIAAVLVAAAWMLPAARAAEPPPDVARGRHIATAMTHCTGCHAADLGGGRSFPVGTNGGRVVAGNLTAGAGGIGNAYSDADYIRAIRQGVRPDGTRLAIMPSADFAVLTDRDAASLVAYIRSLPPVDRSFPSDSASADVGMPPAHAAATPASMVAAPSSLGAYVAQLGSCTECHGADLHGRTLRGSAAPDISHVGIGAWTAADFTTAMRSGRTPDGRTLHEPMPWRAIGGLTDAELAALYDFLEATPAKPAPRTSS